jgi:hypothetical protein
MKPRLCLDREIATSVFAGDSLLLCSRLTGLCSAQASGLRA